MKTILFAAAAALLAGSLASAQTTTTYFFEPFEFDYGSGVTEPILNPINLTLEVVDDGSAVIFNISNESSGAWTTSEIPTITSIYFEDGDGLLFSPTFLGGSGVDYDPAQPGGNLPGGNNIGFDEAFFFAAEPPPVVNGIDPGETGSFGATASYDDVIASINSGDLRIGLHVQQIGYKDLSASYILVPEPSTALLSLFSLAGFLFIRRRR